MTGYMVDAAGRRWRLPALEQWRMDYGLGQPCDSFWLRCPWEKDNTTQPEGWVMFHGEHQGERVFTGLVDECEVTLGREGRMLEVSGRGMAARLLDNQALGQDYQRATLADILRDHVAPYGVQVAPGAQLPAVERFSVDTGSSEWSVVYEFARYYGGISPHFDRQGRLVLAPWQDSRERVVDDAAPVTALCRRDRRYGALSQVLVRDRWSGRVEAVEDAAFRQAGGMARRVVTMPSRANYKAMRYNGSFQLQRSAEERLRLELTVAQAFCAWPGELVRLRRSHWEWNGRYRVVQAVCAMDHSGYWTRLELARPEIVI